MILPKKEWGQSSHLGSMTSQISAQFSPWGHSSGQEKIWTPPSISGAPLLEVSGRKERLWEASEGCRTWHTLAASHPSQTEAESRGSTATCPPATGRDLQGQRRQPQGMGQLGSAPWSHSQEAGAGGPLRPVCQRPGQQAAVRISRSLDIEESAIPGSPLKI